MMSFFSLNDFFVGYIIKMLNQKEICFSSMINLISFNNLSCSILIILAPFSKYLFSVTSL